MEMMEILIIFLTNLRLFGFSGNFFVFFLKKFWNNLKVFFEEICPHPLLFHLQSDPDAPSYYQIWDVLLKRTSNADSAGTITSFNLMNFGEKQHSLLYIFVFSLISCQNHWSVTYDLISMFCFHDFLSSLYFFLDRPLIKEGPRNGGGQKETKKGRKNAVGWWSWMFWIS